MSRKVAKLRNKAKALKAAIQKEIDDLKDALFRRKSLTVEVDSGEVFRFPCVFLTEHTDSAFKFRASREYGSHVGLFVTIDRPSVTFPERAF